MTDNPAPTQPADPSAPPESTSEPTPVPAHPAIAVTGPEEIVFDWTFDACDPEDIPDLPARAFRDADGLVHLIATHFTGRASIGPSLNELTRDCSVISRSGHDGNPAGHNDNEWIAAVYTEDGSTVYATIHNEYHGWEHGNCATNQVDFSCWYNSLTLAVSTDGGRSFTEGAPPPAHFVAGLPYSYEAGAGPYGVMEPSNILKAKDGLYYQVIRIDDIHSPEQWVCLIRTDNLADPGSWRAWDGAGFNTSFSDPYANPDADAADHLCAPLARDQIGVLNQSLTYNSFLDRYVLLGLSADTIDGREVWGIFYSFSEDLVNWSRRQLLWERELPWVWEPGDAQPLLYPTLLDPDSPSISFDVTGQSAYLYFTIFNPGGHLDRDLVRVPVSFYESKTEARAADTRTLISDAAAATTTENLQIDGRLQTIGGSPLSGQTLEISMRSTEDGPGSYAEYTISGVVPSGTADAILGYRVHTECSCLQEASEFFLYDMRFFMSGNLQFELTGPGFEQGLAGADFYAGAEFAALEPGDLGEGQMLHVNVPGNQVAAANLAGFRANGAESFTVTFGARIPPAAEGTGVFVLLFVNAGGEIDRYTIDFKSIAQQLGTATTDSEGVFHFVGPAPTYPGLVTILFPGAGPYLPVWVTLQETGP